MIKYFILILMISMLSCGDKATDSNSQTATEPTASVPAAASNSTVPTEPASTPTTTSTTKPETKTTPTTNQPSATAQVVPGQKSPLTGTYWKLIELNGKNIEGKTTKEMYLFLDPSSPQFKSHSGCNLVMGEVKTSGSNKMWFINLLPTTMPCNTPEIDVEFQKALEEVAEYNINGNNLQLNKKGSVPVMKFVAKK